MPNFRREALLVAFLALLLVGCMGPAGDTEGDASTPPTSPGPLASADPPPTSTGPDEGTGDTSCERLRPAATVAPLLEGDLQHAAQFVATHLDLGDITVDESRTDVRWDADRARLTVTDLRYDGSTATEPYAPEWHQFTLSYTTSLDNLSELLPLARALDPFVEWNFADTGVFNTTRIVHPGLERVDPFTLHGGSADEADGDGGVTQVVFANPYDWTGGPALSDDAIDQATKEALVCSADAHGLKTEAFEEIAFTYHQEVEDGHARWMSRFDHEPGGAGSRDCFARVETVVDPVNGSWSAAAQIFECG